MAQDIVDRVTGKQVARNSKRKLSGMEKFWLIFRYIALVLIWYYTTFHTLVWYSLLSSLTKITEDGKGQPLSKINVFKKDSC